MVFTLNSNGFVYYNNTSRPYDFLELLQFEHRKTVHTLMRVVPRPISYSIYLILPTTVVASALHIFCMREMAAYNGTTFRPKYKINNDCYLRVHEQIHNSAEIGTYTTKRFEWIHMFSKKKKKRFSLHDILRTSWSSSCAGQRGRKTRL